VLFLKKDLLGKWAIWAGFRYNDIPLSRYSEDIPPITSDLSKFISEIIYFISALFKISSEQKIFSSELFAPISVVKNRTSKLPENSDE